MMKGSYGPTKYGCETLIGVLAFHLVFHAHHYKVFLHVEMLTIRWCMTVLPGFDMVAVP